MSPCVLAPVESGKLNGEPELSLCQVGFPDVLDSVQLRPFQLSNVSATQKEGRSARTRITTSFPSDPLMAVSSGPANPKNPPTLVGPEGEAPRTGCPPPLPRPAGVLIEMLSEDDEGNVTLLEA